MFDIVKDIDQWGKGSLFKYGFLQSLVIMLIFLLCAWLCKRAINRWIRKKEIVNAKFVMRIVKITLYTIAIYGCLSLLTPFESVLGKIWGSAGIIAVVLGLAAQESMGNFVNGLLITTFKPFKIGDLVKVNNGEYEGYVVDISLRDTVIRTYENTKVIIPNSTMNKAVLENVSLTNHTKGNFLTLDIAYESDLDEYHEGRNHTASRLCGSPHRGGYAKPCGAGYRSSYLLQRFFPDPACHRILA